MISNKGQLHASKSILLGDGAMYGITWSYYEIATYSYIVIQALYPECISVCQTESVWGGGGGGGIYFVHGTGEWCAS